MTGELDALREKAAFLADRAARAVVEPRRFQMDPGMQHDLSVAVADVRNALAAPSTEPTGEGRREEVRRKFKLPVVANADPKDYWTGYAAAVDDVERLAARLHERTALERNPR